MPTLTFSIPDATMLTATTHSARFGICTTRRPTTARTTAPPSVSQDAPVAVPSGSTGVIVPAPASLTRGRPAKQASKSDVSRRISESRRQEPRFSGEQQLDQHELLENLRQFHTYKRLEACLPGAEASRDTWDLQDDAPPPLTRPSATSSSGTTTSASAVASNSNGTAASTSRSGGGSSKGSGRSTSPRLQLEEREGKDPGWQLDEEEREGKEAKEEREATSTPGPMDDWPLQGGLDAPSGARQLWGGAGREEMDVDGGVLVDVEGGASVMSGVELRERGSEGWWREWARRAGVASVAELKHAVAEGRKAANKLVMSNMWLARSLARKYAGDGHDLSLEDLTQEGVFGLIRGLRSYDASKGTKLSTYLYFWVRHAILRAIADQGRLIRVPVYMNSLLQRTRKGRIALREAMGEEPGVDELAAHLGIKRDKVDELEAIERMRMLSLNYCGAEADIDQPQELMDR
eukprot:jgi/Mesvir1/600/Mv02038-RA.4